MKHMMSQTMTACEGSLALACEPQRLRVIEGGLSAHARAAHDDGSAHASPTRDALNVRFLTAALAFVVLLAAIWYASDRYAETKAARILGAAACETIVIGEGDTLWGIAESCGIEGCTTEQVVRHIRQVNGLESSVLRAGRSLRVPVAGDVLQ